MEVSTILALTNLRAMDLGMVAFYIILVYGIAWFVRRHQNTQADYYLAGRSIPWFFIAISTFATLFSTITFVTVPAEVFEFGILLFLGMFLVLPLLPLAVNTILRFFFISPMYTAYEYLEKRYNKTCRMIGASFFLMARLIYMASVLYSASVVFHSIFGMPILTVILVVGFGTLVYTLMGGMRAVIFTDLIQSVMLLIGVIAIFLVISKGIGFDWVGEFRELAATDDRFTFKYLTEPSFYKVGYQDRLNFWMYLYAILHMPFYAVCSDQLVIQRLLSTKGLKEARKTMYTSYAIGMPVGILIWVMGIGLVIFYKSHALPEGTKPSEVLGYFIQTQLPSPIPGIMCAAMLAMIMSTIDSTINSLSAVADRDIIPHFKKNLSDANGVTRSRILTMTWGVIGIGLAVFIATIGQRHGRVPIIELITVLGSGLSLITLTFVLGVFTSWVKPWAMMTSLCTGVCVLVFCQWELYLNQSPESRIGYGYTNLIPLVVTFILVVTLSLLDRRPYSPPEGTTLKSLKRMEKAAT